VIRAWRRFSGPSWCARVAVLVAVLAGTSGAVPRRLQLDAIASVPDFAPVVSPDGAHLYVAGLASLTVFERDAGSGLLTLVEVEVDGVGGVDGIDDARSVAVSPEGTHVDVTGFADDAVAVFARDPVSGAVTFVDVVGDMDGAWPIVVSPDGARVYVAGRGAIWAFVREAATGALSIHHRDRTARGLGCAHARHFGCDDTVPAQGQRGSRRRARLHYGGLCDRRARPRPGNGRPLAGRAEAVGAVHRGRPRAQPRLCQALLKNAERRFSATC
jgi:hypothetical protein